MPNGVPRNGCQAPIGSAAATARERERTDSWKYRYWRRVSREKPMPRRQARLVKHHPRTEGDIREQTKKRSVNAGTHSDLGRRCQDTFFSLKKSCRK
jgi:hypothetical protein